MKKNLYKYLSATNTPAAASASAFRRTATAR